MARPQPRRRRHRRAANYAQGNEQGVGRAMAGRERRSDLAEGRFVSLAQRAQRLAAFLSLRGQRHARSGKSRRASGKFGARTASIPPARGSTSRQRHTVRSASTCIAFGWTAPSLQRVSTTAGRHQVFVNPSRTLFLDSWSDITTPPQVRLHNTTTRDAGPRRRCEPCSGAERARAVDARADAGEDARRVRHGSDDDQAAGLRSGAAISGVPVHVCGPAFSAGRQRVGRHGLSLSSAARPARHHRVDLRQPHRQRQGHAVGVAAVQELRRARAAGHRRRRSPGSSASRTSTDRASASPASASART